MTHLLPIKNSTSKAQKRLEVVFALTRSSIASIRVATTNAIPTSNESLLACQAALPGKGQVWFVFEKAVAAGVEIVLLVEFDAQEPPRLDEDSPPEWNSPSIEALNALSSDRGLRDIAKLDFRKFFDGLDFFEAFRNWDSFLIAEPDPALRHYKAFFHALDLLTNQDLQVLTMISEEEKLRKKGFFDKALRFMKQHVIARLQSLVAGTSTRLSDLPTEPEPIVATAVSDLMLPVYRHFFAVEKSLDKHKVVLDENRMAEAFCRFANGELRTTTSLDENAWNCEPDSVNHIYFAYHALWSILSQVPDEADWGKILRCSAASQQFFMHAYYPDGEPPLMLDQYGPEKYRPTPKLTQEEIAAVFSKFRKMNHQEISNQMDVNLKHMLKGTFRGTDRSKILEDISLASPPAGAPATAARLGRLSALA